MLELVLSCKRDESTSVNQHSHPPVHGVVLQAVDCPWKEFGNFSDACRAVVVGGWYQIVGSGEQHGWWIERRDLDVPRGDGSSLVSLAISRYAPGRVSHLANITDCLV